MSLESDLDASTIERQREAERRHEEAMRPTKLKIAKIEARRDIKIARSRDENFLMKQCIVALMGLVAFIALCVTYANSSLGHTHMPASVQIQQQRSNDARYSACLSKGWDYDTASNQCSRP